MFGRNVLSKKTIGPPNCNCPSFHSSNYRFCLDKEASEHELIPEARRQKWSCPLISTKKHVTRGQVIWLGILLVIPALKRNEQTFASLGGRELGKASTRRTSGRIEMRYRLDGRTSVLFQQCCFAALVSLAYSFNITIASWGPKASW